MDSMEKHIKTVIMFSVRHELSYEYALQPYQILVMKSLRRRHKMKFT